MNTSMFTASSKSYPPHTVKIEGGGGNKIVVGTVVKANIGELEEELRERFSIRMRKELTGVVQIVFGKKRLLCNTTYVLVL